jgi:hypothetical protein
MSDRFKDLFPPIKKKKFFATIQGKEVEVTHKEKLEIIKNGEENYILENGKPQRKVTLESRISFPELEKLTADPFWPKQDFVWKL